MPSVTRKAAGKRAARRDEMIGRFLEAVESLLSANQSYTEISVERLVAEAGVSRSTFYVYFEDKGDLLRALTGDVMAQVMKAASRWWALPPSSTRAQFRETMKHLLDVYQPHQALMAAVVEASSYDAAVRQAYEQLMSEAIGAVADHIREGQRQGFIRKDIDPDPTAAWLSWMAERGLYALAPPANKKEAERLVESLTSIVWNTLYAGMREEQRS